MNATRWDDWIKQAMICPSGRRLWDQSLKDSDQTIHEFVLANPPTKAERPEWWERLVGKQGETHG